MKNTNSTDTYIFGSGLIEFQYDDDDWNVHMESENAKSNVSIDFVEEKDRGSIVKCWDVATTSKAFEALPQSQDYYEKYPNIIMKKSLENHKKHNPWTHFAIRDSDDNFVGEVELLSAPPGTATLGYAITAEERRKGYAKASAGMMLPYASLLVEKGYKGKNNDEVGLVLGDTSVNNIASQKVMSGIGMTRITPDPSDALVVDYSYEIPPLNKILTKQPSISGRS